MSYKRRQARLAQRHEFYETPSGNGLAWSGDTDVWSPEFPGPRETLLLDSQNFQTFNTAPSDMMRVDEQVGGVAGFTKFMGGMGVTDPQTVDAHNFQGMYAEIRRLPDWHDGPVSGGTDYNSLLPILYAMQETARYYPQEVVQADLLKAV